MMPSSRHRLRSLLLLQFSLVLLLLLASQSYTGPQPPPTNILYGFITSNDTLTYSAPGPVYYLPGDVVINPGASLTIEPGVTLVLSANSDTLGGGVHPTLTDISVSGTLVADASAGDSIRIVSSAAGAVEWGEIVIQVGGLAILDKVSMSGPVRGLTVYGQVNASRVSVSKATNGVFLETGSTGYLRECALSGTGTGRGLQIKGASTASTAVADSTDPRPTIISGFYDGAYVTGSNCLVSHLVVHDNLNDGIYIKGADCVVNYCTAVRNGRGVTSDNSWYPRVYSTISTDNSGSGIYLEDGGYDPYMNYTDSWNNGSDYGPGAGSHTASFNPFYVDFLGNDFRLSDGSIFKVYGPWGAEIGAYGPGPGQPVQAQETTWGRVKAERR
jgi:hypothetical protein